MAPSITPLPTQPNHNPSPKQRFQQSNDNVSKHRDLTASREFERGMDFAMLEMCSRLAATITDGNSAMAAGFRLMGAHEFAQNLKLLSEKPATLNVKQDTHLDHRA